MAALTDIRKTNLELVNEVRRKLGMATVTNTNSDSESRSMVDYLNDVVQEINDYGNWKELLRETIVTASTSVSRYTINTSGRPCQRREYGRIHER